MRKNILSLSIAAMIGGLGFAGSASAVTALVNDAAVTATQLQVTASNKGHILTVPYFTTQNNNMTLLNIVNSDTINGKAVKVRFRSALNSDDIFDFQLYLSAGDVWAAQVTATATGVSTLSTKDNSCTLPAVVSLPFVTDRLPLSGTAQANLTREGYIEILNMADIPLNTATGTLSKAITHASGVPACAGLQSAALNLGVDKTVAQAAAIGMTNPTGNLFANYSIVNVSTALAFSGEAVAIQASNAGGASAAGALVWFPQTDTSVSASNILPFSADPVLRVTGGAMFDLPDLSTPYTTAALTVGGQAGPVKQAWDLSGALATKGIANEFITDPSIVAATDWVFSMTTRRYNAAVNYTVTSTASTSGRIALTDYSSALNGSLTNYFDLSNVSLDTTDSTKLCVSIDTGTNYYDRSETTTGTSFVISPGRAQSVKLCGETSVLSFNAGGVTAASVLASSVARSDVTLSYTDGWAQMYTTGIGNKGLPITGKAFVKAVNSFTAPGSTSTFGGSFEHRYSR